ncbi:MAG TPA: BrnA antitoxin family protein [Gammaproteobacteria bacterium]|nr:BrnA antitoxin family protein [Gammaproteobacteria bacterium]
MKKPKKLPKFKTLLREEIFWHKHDSADYIDWRKAKHIAFPNLKPSTKTISLRLPQDLLNEIKILANKEDVPYQSLMKMLLIRGIHVLRKY